MKTISKITFITILFLSLLVSCKGEDGEAGADGNANVTTITLDSSDITWTTGSYIAGIAANKFVLTDSSVNQDIIDHGSVLGYLSLNNDEWLPMPLQWESLGGDFVTITFTYYLNTITLYAYYGNTGFTPTGIDKYKFLLITDNTVTGRTSVSGNIKQELLHNGIDINNYYEVCNYYGINPN